MGACDQVDSVLIGFNIRRSGFDSQCWSCVEVLGKLHISHCLGPPSRNGYLVHRSKVGSIVAVCCAPTATAGKVGRTYVDTWISGLVNMYRYLYL